jgi:calcineurin-like phosphoesterase family protein
MRKKMIWVTADNHFGHDNILSYCNRPFRSVAQMNEAMIRNWNRVVKYEDIIYHLGDFSFGLDVSARKIMKRLKGYKILVKGNHDHSKERMLSIGFDEVYRGPITRYDVILTHFPMYIPGKTTMNVGVDVNNFTPIPFPMHRPDRILCGHIHQFWKYRQYHGKKKDAKNEYPTDTTDF